MAKGKGRKSCQGHRSSFASQLTLRQLTKTRMAAVRVFRIADSMESPASLQVVDESIPSPGELTREPVVQDQINLEAMCSRAPQFPISKAATLRKRCSQHLH